MRDLHRNMNVGASIFLTIALCAAWLIISVGCGREPAVSRPNKPLPQTQQVDSVPEEFLK